MNQNTFAPVEHIDLYCRFCKKVLGFQLERGIAGSGKTVDKQSTFEYFCTKCHHTICFFGRDLLAKEENSQSSENPRNYIAKERYLLGEVIRHQSFKDIGTVVGKDVGSPSRILVKFEKKGLKKLVENI